VVPIHSQVFGAVARAETDITALIHQTLEAVGRTDSAKVTAFTDGCPGLRAVQTNAGVTKPRILDRFHIAMRLQHTKLAGANLSTDHPDRVTAKALIVSEAERLHWRIWNGKAKNASAASSGSERSCTSSKASTATARRVWRHASCGTRCMPSTNISAAKPHGWSTTPNDSGPDCTSERRSPRAQRTS
jgi:hypothetical protein